MPSLSQKAVVQDYGLRGSWGSFVSPSWFKASRAHSAIRILSSKVENQASFHLAAINFIKGFVNIFKFSRLTFDPCFPCGMQLKGLGKIHAIAEEGSLDRYIVYYRLKNG